MKICSHEKCERKAVCKGFCDKHYRRLLKNGSAYDSGSRIVHEGNAVQRFHQKYEKQNDGCWIWIGSSRPNSKGVLYGRHHNELGDSEGAHRFSYRNFKDGDVKGYYICHKCDTPLCVNPEHLFKSDHAGNMQDMVNKGRSYKGFGERKGCSKLTNKQAKEIKASKKSAKILSHAYGVSESTINRVKRGETYSEIKRLSTKVN